MIWIMCVFFAVFFAVSYATRSDEKIQAQRLKIIENCKLKQVEATSFDRQNGILTVVVPKYKEEEKALKKIAIE